MERIEIGTTCTADEFAPFGTFIVPPAQAGERQFYSDWLGGEALAPVFHVNHVQPASLPISLARLERHPHAAQCFVPLDVSRYVVTVAPALTDGTADRSAIKSFILPGTIGVIYRPGVWHAGASVLDRAGSFAVLMWRGANDDDVFADIAPLELVAP